MDRGIYGEAQSGNWRGRKRMRNIEKEVDGILGSIQRG
jgi:hypothetical protein